MNVVDFGPDDLVPLSEAAHVFLHGRLSKSALRTEARKGNLEIIRIANKDFVTRNGVNQMIDRCRKGGKASDISSSPVACPSGSNEVSPRAAALQMLKQLKENMPSKSK